MTSSEYIPETSVDQFVNNVLRGRSELGLVRHPFAHDFSNGGFESTFGGFARAGADRMRRSRLPILLDRYGGRPFEDQLSETAHIGAELFLEVAIGSGLLGRSITQRLFSPQDKRRFLYVPSDGYRQPVMLVLDPMIKNPPAALTEYVPKEGFSRTFFNTISKQTDRTNIPSDFSAAIRQGGEEILLDILDIARPEIILAHKPRMERLCAPWPYVDVQCGAQLSTAGIFCHDDAGQLGVTACYHGTGDVGTPVQIGLGNFKVAAVNQVQDIVFVPIGNGYNIPSLRAVMGMYPDKSPSVLDTATFWGASSGQTETRIVSMDAYVFRNRPSMQMKLQTLPNTNTGDSGAALISSDDRVLGFAFERTAFGEFPEMTDWIWASNALRALKLTPF